MNAERARVCEFVCIYAHLFAASVSFRLFCAVVISKLEIGEEKENIVCGTEISKDT